MASDQQLPPYERAPFVHYQSPNPTWKAFAPTSSTPNGKKWLETADKVGWKTFEMIPENNAYLYNVLKSGIVPRPVAFVSSISENGVENLAPFSYFTVAAAKPPMVSISCGTNPHVRDTSHNIRATKEYTINLISEPWVEQAHMASIDTPIEHSEWEVTGLTKLPSTIVKAPRVKESAFSIECVFHQVVELGGDIPPAYQVTGQMLIGRVVAIHVRNDMFTPDSTSPKGTQSVDPARLMPIARLGGISYGGIGPGYRVGREEWEYAKKVIEKKAKNGSATGDANGSVNGNANGDTNGSANGDANGDASMK